MNIDTSGLSYSPIPGDTKISQSTGPEANKQMDQTQRGPKPDFKTEISEQVKSAQKPSTEKNKFYPLSRHLSMDEKMMLNKLFPPNDVSNTIHTYSQDRKPVGKPVSLGQSIDLKG